MFQILLIKYIQYMVKDIPYMVKYIPYIVKYIPYMVKYIPHLVKKKSTEGNSDGQDFEHLLTLIVQQI